MEISKKDIIIKAWIKLKENISIWVLIMLFMLILNLLLSSIQERFLEEMSFHGIAFIVSSYLFQAGINLGLVGLSLNIYRDKTINFSQIFNNFHLLGKYVFASGLSIIVFFIFCLPGLMLLFFSVFVYDNSNVFSSIFMAISIIGIAAPVIYISIRLQFYQYYLVDEETTPYISIQKSIKITKGYEAELFILGAILSLIILISMVPLLLGLFISIPLAAMVNAKVYLLLKESNKTDK